ncbi:hypothetical protein POVWA1_013760 [Plasmodium ovale wallikeri]|uniref:Uncharacterized protein n=1 Tax=Plasmodium ovale wallikeri TaxID=864142 RepID=A0A1A8YN15_PLAOA|nr:hypothetical protein POVWA1_013760 [Plasmodium ovale wallikeri]
MKGKRENCGKWAAKEGKKKKDEMEGKVTKKGRKREDKGTKKRRQGDEKEKTRGRQKEKNVFSPCCELKPLSFRILRKRRKKKKKKKKKKGGLHPSLVTSSKAKWDEQNKRRACTRTTSICFANHGGVNIERYPRVRVPQQKRPLHANTHTQTRIRKHAHANTHTQTRTRKHAHISPKLN